MACDGDPDGLASDGLAGDTAVRDGSPSLEARARAALAAGRWEEARIVFGVLKSADPTVAALWRGEAEALARLGRSEEALAAYTQAAALDPNDPWAPFGRCAALADLGRRVESRDCLWALKPSTDPNLRALALELLGRLLREEAAERSAAGDARGALALAKQAVTLAPGLWSSMTLGQVALEAGEAGLAIEAYTAALAREPTQSAARRGLVAALDSAGRAEEAQRRLRDWAAAGTLDPALVDRARRQETAAALTALKAGDPARAALLAAETARTWGEDGDLACVAAAAALEMNRGAEALAAARRAMAAAPGDWAAGLLVAAGRATGQSGAVAAELRAAGRPEAEAADLDGWRQAVAAADRRTLRQLEARLAARPQPAAAESLAEAFLKQERPRAALRVLAGLPPEPAVARLMARSYLALGRPNAALALPLGTEAADALLRAEAALVKGEAATAQAALPGAGAPAWAAPLAKQVREGVEELGPGAAVGAVGRLRGPPGAPADLRALVTPVRVVAPLGTLRLAAEAQGLRLSDDDGADAGLALAFGLASPPRRALSGDLALGTSPIGLLGGAYPLWSGGLSWRPAPALRVDLRSQRAPLTDSRAAWASVLYAPTGQRVGRASAVEGALSLSASPQDWDLGLEGRAGWIEGFGIAPDPTRQGLFWAGKRLSAGPVDLRLGVDGLSRHVDRSLAAVLPGEAGAFSPAWFLTGAGRLEAALSPGDWGLCLGGGLGARSIDEGDGLGSPAPVGAAAVALGRHFDDRLTLQAEAGRERVATDWQQSRVGLHLSWGAPTPSLLSSPSAGPACALPRVNG